MKPSEVLEKMGEVLEERGWCQGYTEDVNGKVCLYGAAYVAVYGSAKWSDRERNPQGDLISATMTPLIDVVKGNVVAFNDSPSTSEEDVKLAVKRAAEWSRELEEIDSNA